MISFADIVVDLRYGDCGKGAVVYELCKDPRYDIVLRWNGGSNAGHTIYHNGVKFATHLIPTGIFHGKLCVIGSGCVVNPRKFFEELESLRNMGIETEGKVFIAKNAHIVTEEHIASEQAESKIGTTKQGIGPAYAAKHARTGIRAESVPELAPYLVDLYELFYSSTPYGVLAEGAQGFDIDIDWCAEYPFSSSSIATVAGAIQNGIPWDKVRKVFGVAKAYDTYVGSRDFEPKNAIFQKLRELGSEFGATTGRPRQCNWLDLYGLTKAIEVNSVTDVVISKMDILRELNKQTDNQNWCFAHSRESLPGEDSFVAYLSDHLMKLQSVKRLHWRNSPTDSMGNGTMFCRGTSRTDKTQLEIMRDILRQEQFRYISKEGL